MTYQVLSVCCIFTRCRLVTASNVLASSASVFTFLLADDCLTTNQTADFSCLWHLGMDCTGNLSNSSSNCCVTKLSRGSRREHRFLVTPLMHIRNLLPMNGHCLQSHYLATGLRATCMCVNIYIYPYIMIWRLKPELSIAWQRLDKQVSVTAGRCRGIFIAARILISRDNTHVDYNRWIYEALDLVFCLRFARNYKRKADHSRS
jgi:hypothetical protein